MRLLSAITALLIALAAGAAVTPDYIIIGGETSNSAASRIDDIREVFRRAEQRGYNTVLIPVSWELIEPREGQYNFSSLDNILSTAQRSDINVGLLWFGAWKNSMSCYAPAWVKTDTRRFPRARVEGGKPLEIVSPFSAELLKADSAAFAALVGKIASHPARQKVALIQIENEIGMLESARDHSELANAIYAKGVPGELTSWLASHAETLHPTLIARWKANGSKAFGSWEEVFGKGAESDEIFMAYNYARYVESLARIGRERLPDMPLYLNAALNSRGRRPGQYPSAGPLAHLKDIYHCGAPTIDFLAPDIYDPGFSAWAGQYALPDNPLFIPEIKASADNPVQTLYALGAHDALGVCQFAFDRQPESSDSAAYDANTIMQTLEPLLLRSRGKGLSNGIYLESDTARAIILRDSLCITARHALSLPWAPKTPMGVTPAAGGGLLLRVGPDEYILAGRGVVLTFEPLSALMSSAANVSAQLGEDGFAAQGSPAAAGGAGAAQWRGQRIGLASVDVVDIRPNGDIQSLRTLNGDETHQGRHVRIDADDFNIIRFKLYRYE